MTVEGQGDQVVSSRDLLTRSRRLPFVSDPNATILCFTLSFRKVVGGFDYLRSASFWVWRSSLYEYANRGGNRDDRDDQNRWERYVPKHSPFLLPSPLPTHSHLHLAPPPASFPARGSITRGRDGQLLPKGSHRKSNGCSVESSCSPRRLRQGRARDHIRRASCSSCPRNVQGTIGCRRKKWSCSNGCVLFFLSSFRFSRVTHVN